MIRYRQPLAKPFLISIRVEQVSLDETLVALHQEVEKRGFQMFIVGPVGRVARVMKRLGSYNILHVRQSLGEVMTEVEMILQLAKEQLPTRFILCMKSVEAGHNRMIGGHIARV